MLGEFLSQGASVHLRNRNGHTPLYLAAAAGLRDHVEMLKEAGAHLHSEEFGSARLHAAEEREELEEKRKTNGGSGGSNGAVWGLVVEGT